jgi:hypothetical protein
MAKRNWSERVTDSLVEGARLDAPPARVWSEYHGEMVDASVLQPNRDVAPPAEPFRNDGMMF